MLHINRQTRQNFRAIIDQLSIEQLNHIPQGYNNNILWNYAHIIVTQQLLTYGLSDLPLTLDAEMVSAFRKGSQPERPYTEEELAHFKTLATSTLDQFEADKAAGKFTAFKTYPTSFGIELHSLEEAEAFNNVHEALHLGVVMNMRRLV
jgi:hypothetical protein